MPESAIATGTADFGEAHFIRAWAASGPSAVFHRGEWATAALCGHCAGLVTGGVGTACPTPTEAARELYRNMRGHVDSGECARFRARTEITEPG